MIKLELSEQMISIIGAALGKAPYEVVSPVIAELQRQIDPQLQKNDGNDESTVIPLKKQAE